MSLQNVQYLVGCAMRDNYALRLHRNRHRLYLFVMNQAKTSISPESVFRAQRKLWEKGLYLPEGKDFEEWQQLRTNKVIEYIDYSKY